MQSLEVRTLPRYRRWWQLLRQAVRGDEQEYTTGSIDRAIVLLSIPMILEMAMESLFAVVDAFFVARVSVEAVATVGYTESILTLVYSLGIGLASAATAMVARRVGEGRREAAAQAGAQAIVIGVALSVLMAVPGYFFAEHILRFMTTDEAVIATGTTFTRIMFTCNLPILLLWMLNGVFRGAGDAATAMRALWIANGVNIVLDPLLIFGWGPFPALGVTGAAVATTIGRSTGVVYQLWQLFGVGRIIRLQWAYFRPQLGIIRRQLELAAGAAGQYLIASASWIFLMYLLGHYLGKEVTAGYTIALRIMMFTILPAWGMSNAAATLVGQNLGAGQPDRAERSTRRAAFFNIVFMGVVTVLYQLASPWLIAVFTSDPGAQRAGTEALRVISAGYVFYGLGMIMTQSINGAGDTRTPTLLNFIFFWLVEIPLAWLLTLTFNWGAQGVYWSIVITESLLALAATWVFRKGKWKLAKV